jgi:glycosyltransferase involved in cell wall biosynthesis
MHILMVGYDWGLVFQRPQQLALRLAREHEVLYRGSGEFWGRRILNRLRQGSPPAPLVRRPRANLTVVSIPHGLPFRWQERWPRLDHGLATLGASLVAEPKGSQYFDAAMLFSTALVDVLTWLPVRARVKVYDCFDENVHFFPPGSPAAINAERAEKLAVQNADLVLASALPLKERLDQEHANVVLVPNGAAFEYLSSSESLPVPPELAGVTGPVLGFVGTVEHWVNVELIAQVAQELPDFTLVIVGPLECDVTVLRGKPNIILPGRQPYERLPAFLQRFDVAMIPFVESPLTRAVDPVKFYEYSAMGKPVVATPLPTLQARGNLVYRARTGSEFAAQVRRAIQEDSPERRHERIEFARQNSWASRVDVIVREISRLLDRKIGTLPFSPRKPVVSLFSRAGLKPPVRIGFNASFYTGKPVGVDVFILNLARELARSWELYIYTSMPEAFATHDAILRPVPRFPRGQRQRLGWVWTRLPQHLKADRIDLLFSAFSELPLRTRVPAIAVVHDLTPLTLKGSSPWPHTLRFWLALHMLRNATALITDADFTRRELERRNWFKGKPIHVVQLGTSFHALAQELQSNLPKIGTLPFSPRKPVVSLFSWTDGIEPSVLACLQNRKYLLYVGGFASHKNVRVLLEAFQELTREIPLQLVLVGWGPEDVFAELKTRITAMHLTERTTILSGLPDRTLAWLYSSCELFVCPSRLEGFGFPVLEAMACGAPVLCSNASSLPEVGGDAVMYFSPDSKDELTRAIRTLVADPGLRQELAQKGLRRSGLFTWERTAAAYSAVFRQVLDQVRLQVTS